MTKHLNRGLDNAIIMDGFKKSPLIETLMKISNNRYNLQTLSKNANFWSKNCTYEKYINEICNIIFDNSQILNPKNAWK